MTLEDLEHELRGRIIEKNWEVDDVFPADDFFLLQLRGFYKRKELKYTDLLDVGSKVRIVNGETWQECYEKLLKEI